MRIFEDINPATLLDDHRIVGLFTYYDETSLDGTHLLALQDEDYLLLCRCYRSASDVLNPTGVEWMGGIVLEIPTHGLKWFVDTLENKFFKTEAAGGLPRGQYADEVVMLGERLTISRMFGVPGYKFTNHSRLAHFAGNDPSFLQELNLSDELLFEHGYFAELKAWAALIK